MLWETAGVCVPIQIIRKQKIKLKENYQLLPSRGQGQLCWRRLESAGEFRAWGWLKKLYIYNAEEKCWKPLRAPTYCNQTHPLPRKHKPILPWGKGPLLHRSEPQICMAILAECSNSHLQDFILPSAIYSHNGNAQQCLLLSQGRVHGEDSSTPMLSCSRGTLRAC